MSMDRLIPSPSCQLPKKAMAALEQATIDEVLEPGAFSEMGHLPVAGVLNDALEYAQTLLDGMQEGASTALRPGASEYSLLSMNLMDPDAAFISQVLALQDLAVANAVQPDGEVEDGPTVGELIGAARGHLVERYHNWFAEPGRHSDKFRIQRGPHDHLYPVAMAVGTSSKLLPGSRPDGFALFVALPLVAPFLNGEEDCFVAPRLE